MLKKVEDIVKKAASGSPNRVLELDHLRIYLVRVLKDKRHWEVKKNAIALWARKLDVSEKTRTNHHPRIHRASMPLPLPLPRRRSLPKKSPGISLGEGGKPERDAVNAAPEEYIDK